MLALAAATQTLSACASTSDSEYRMGTEPDTPLSKADPAAYGADGFTFNKLQKRREPNAFMFYFKQCTLEDARSYYSKTSYWCNDP